MCVLPLSSNQLEKQMSHAEVKTSVKKQSVARPSEHNASLRLPLRRWARRCECVIMRAAACVRLSRGCCCCCQRQRDFFATRASKKRARSVCSPVIAHAKQCNSMCNYLLLQSNLADKQRIIIKLCVCGVYVCVCAPQHTKLLLSVS